MYNVNSLSHVYQVFFSKKFMLRLDFMIWQIIIIPGEIVFYRALRFEVTWVTTPWKCISTNYDESKVI